MPLDHLDCIQSFELERSELESVLKYTPIARSPSLASILRYVCAQYFAGDGAQIKEYNIGVEALGRPATYQPRLDPIVRVEMSRLRKRLAAFYEAEGTDHTVRISIPPGQYVPAFLSSVTSSSPNLAAADSVVLRRTDFEVSRELQVEYESNGRPERPSSQTQSSSDVERAERAEFEAVISCQLLRRSPTILRLAEYIGQRYFEPDVSTIKEYSIAVDALGRPPGFDSKEDSIVRVEAHRLRKKLDEYYKTEGRNHALRLVLEPGQYIPKFVPQMVQDELQSSAMERDSQKPPEAIAKQTPRPPWSSLPWFVLGGLAAAAVALLFVSQMGAFHTAPKLTTFRLMSGALRYHSRHHS